MVNYVCGFLLNDFKSKITTFSFFRKCCSLYGVLLYFIFFSWIRGEATSNKNDSVHEGLKTDPASKATAGHALYNNISGIAFERAIFPNAIYVH